MNYNRDGQIPPSDIKKNRKNGLGSSMFPDEVMKEYRKVWMWCLIGAFREKTQCVYWDHFFYILDQVAGLE